MTDRGKYKKTCETSTFANIINGANGRYVVASVAIISVVSIVCIAGTVHYATFKGYDSALSIGVLKLTLSHEG